MEHIINAYRQKNHYLAILKDIAKSANGKSLKWLGNKVEKYDICLHTDSSTFYQEFYLSRAVNIKAVVSEGRNILVLFKDNWLDDKDKVRANMLIEAINAQLEHNSKEIELMEQNAKDKARLINKYNSLVDELNALAQSMSIEFLAKYGKEFKDVDWG